MSEDACILFTEVLGLLIMVFENMNYLFVGL